MDFEVHKSKASAPEDATPSSTCEASDAVAASQEELAQIAAPEHLVPVQVDMLDLNLLRQLSFIFSDCSFRELRS